MASSEVIGAMVLFVCVLATLGFNPRLIWAVTVTTRGDDGWAKKVHTSVAVSGRAALRTQGCGQREVVGPDCCGRSVTCVWPWQSSAHLLLFLEHDSACFATLRSATGISLTNMVVGRESAQPAVPRHGRATSFCASVHSSQQHRTRPRATRPSATYSNWTRQDAQEDGQTSPSCAGRSRSMRRTDDVSDTHSTCVHGTFFS